MFAVVGMAIVGVDGGTLSHLGLVCYQLQTTVSYSGDL